VGRDGRAGAGGGSRLSSIGGGDTALASGVVHHGRMANAATAAPRC